MMSLFHLTTVNNPKLNAHMVNYDSVNYSEYQPAVLITIELQLCDSSLSDSYSKSKKRWSVWRGLWWRRETVKLSGVQISTLIHFHTPFRSCSTKEQCIQVYLSF